MNRRLILGTGGHLAVLDDPTGQVVGEIYATVANRAVSWGIGPPGRGMNMSVVEANDDQVSRFELHDRPVTMTLTLSPQAADLIDMLGRDLALSRDAVITQSLMLLKVASEAIHRGKAVGIAASADSLETEIVGIGSDRR